MITTSTVLLNNHQKVSNDWQHHIKSIPILKTLDDIQAIGKRTKSVNPIVISNVTKQITPHYLLRILPTGFYLEETLQHTRNQIEYKWNQDYVLMNGQRLKGLIFSALPQRLNAILADISSSTADVWMETPGVQVKARS